MENKTEILLEEAKQKFNGYSTLYSFYLMNLCIKAEAVALLSATIEHAGESFNIEDVASVSLADDYTFRIKPKSASYVFPISKAFQKDHPEFEMEHKMEKDLFDDQEQTVIYYKMPKVNDDRYKVCTDYINARSEAVLAKLDATMAFYTTKITASLSSKGVEQLEMAKSQLQEYYDFYKNYCLKQKDEKIKEVEQAHNEFIAQEQTKAQADLEKSAAENTQASTSFRIGENQE